MISKFLQKSCLYFRPKNCHLFRHFSTPPPGSRAEECHLLCVKLKSRSLVKISGVGIHDYLQGLITNDIGHLVDKPSIFGLFLNHQGRVLFDSIIYKDPSSSSHVLGDHLLIEVDTRLKEGLVKHLKLYRVKRKIEVDGETTGKSLWTLFDPGHKYDTFININTINENIHNIQVNEITNTSSEQCCDPIVDGFSLKRPEFPFQLFSSDFKEKVCIYSDPRIPLLGWRLILPASSEEEEKEIFSPPPSSEVPTSSSSSSHKLTIGTEKDYREFRYILGIGEGSDDNPPGNCFPLEANADYLSGVSFHKGCYVGQELTARTHHTGVIRKRLMPFRLSKPPSDPSIDSFSNNTGKKVGRIRGISGVYGLALTRVGEALSSPELKLGSSVVTLEKPIWWPMEVSKENQIGKSSDSSD